MRGTYTDPGKTNTNTLQMRAKRLIAVFDSQVCGGGGPMVMRANDRFTSSSKKRFLVSMSSISNRGTTRDAGWTSAASTSCCAAEFLLLFFVFAS